ncbi:MAG TPA: ABC transporter permease subunit, partial [Candidatus Limnocylindria bacterium]|nr:ABC transporter permease subunit [Candidatus Limnocylindria bacterium]
MTVLPVVERELRVASRRGATYWARTGAALTALLVSAWILLLQQQSMAPGLMGKVLFTTLSFISFLFAAFAGVTYSADSVSAEKREGTLGLLFLTDLRGHDVTLGKLAASSLGAVYSLLAALPVLALALLLGGVTGGEYWRMVLLLLNVLLFSLSLGLLMSVLSSDSKRAAVAAFFAV